MAKRSVNTAEDAGAINGNDGGPAAGGGLTLQETAARAGVSPETLRRWAKTGLIPGYGGDGTWSPSAVSRARLVARLRERGHSLKEIKTATKEGRLAFGYIEELFPAVDERVYSRKQAAKETGLQAGLIDRVVAALGMSPEQDSLSSTDVQLLRYVAAVLDAGLPLVATLQLVRVYGQAMAQVADAEVRLFHLYVHEPLMRSGATGVETADEMLAITRELLPLASPVMDQVHQRYLQHFVEQDVVGHMESDLDEDEIDLGRIRVAIAFADLAGYTRLTEEEGELEAVDAVERFVEAVETTLPDDARVIKTIGDAVMVVASDAGALVDWAVGFQQLYVIGALPRIGIHSGHALYRDGDYFGRDVNIASRVAARSGGGEVLVTRSVVERAGPHLEFERIAEVRLRGFTESTEVFLARQAEE
ncbi:MAG TPA: adenylate cyclase regulatory domain-containing protein [Solirubrobacteraceae bacterium]|nr:adenylate cyclase regulatory domain-containing protein [Solirubrobacteraceae bacterium]